MKSLWLLLVNSIGQSSLLTRLHTSIGRYMSSFTQKFLTPIGLKVSFSTPIGFKVSSCTPIGRSVSFLTFYLLRSPTPSFCHYLFFSSGYSIPIGSSTPIGQLWSFFTPIGRSLSFLTFNWLRSSTPSFCSYFPYFLSGY